MNKTTVHIALSEKGRKQLIGTGNSPVIFLAGPVRNAQKWHDDAIRYIASLEKDVFVAVPIRKVADDNLQYVLKDDPFTPTFDRQRAWELHYLELAASFGCTIFWLSNEADVKEFKDKIYAHITMMELGSAIERKSHAQGLFNLVVGVDSSFPEWETIKLDIETKTPTVPIHFRLEDAIDAAFRLIKENYA